MFSSLSRRESELLIAGAQRGDQLRHIAESLQPRSPTQRGGGGGIPFSTREPTVQTRLPPQLRRYLQIIHGPLHITRRVRTFHAMTVDVKKDGRDSKGAASLEHDRPSGGFRSKERTP